MEKNRYLISGEPFFFTLSGMKQAYKLRFSSSRGIGLAVMLMVGACIAQEIKTPFFRGARAEVMISRPARTKGGDFDDQMQTIKPRIKFTNVDNAQNYEGHKASFMVMGESAVDRKVFKILLRHDFNISLPARQVAEETAPDVTTRYDTTGAKFGFKYDGWILIVTDSQGQLVMAKSTSPSIEKMPTQLSALKNGGCYTKDLKAVEEPRLIMR